MAEKKKGREIQWAEEPGRLQSMESQRVGQDSTCTLGKKKINSLVASPQCLNIQQWTFSDSCPPLAYCGRLGNLSPQSVAVKNFLFLHYTEKKTASEVTVDKAQSLFWRADLVYKPRYSTHLFLHGF